jgi:hypothetical protein
MAKQDSAKHILLSSEHWRSRLQVLLDAIWPVDIPGFVAAPL